MKSPKRIYGFLWILGVFAVGYFFTQSHISFIKAYPVKPQLQSQSQSQSQSNETPPLVFITYEKDRSRTLNSHLMLWSLRDKKIIFEREYRGHLTYWGGIGEQVFFHHPKEGFHYRNINHFGEEVSEKELREILGKMDPEFSKASYILFDANKQSFFVQLPGDKSFLVSPLTSEITPTPVDYLPQANDNLGTLVFAQAVRLSSGQAVSFTGTEKKGILIQDKIGRIQKDVGLLSPWIMTDTMTFKPLEIQNNSLHFITVSLKDDKSRAFMVTCWSVYGDQAWQIELPGLTEKNAQWVYGGVAQDKLDKKNISLMDKKIGADGTVDLFLMKRGSYFSKDKTVMIRLDAKTGKVQEEIVF